MIATAIELLLALAWVVLAVPLLVLAVQVFAALGARRGRARADGARPRVAVLMPAHNESTGLLQPVSTVLAQLRDGDRLLVVADNCSDDTAEVARAAGAEVIVRQDATLRGKGYALDFGVKHLAQDAPGVLVIVDADCELTPHALDRIVGDASATGRPVQALYLMRTPPGREGRGSIAEFAWVVKNLVRPLGFHRLGLPCQLMGTGMAFPWQAIQRTSLASGHIVEDMQMGIDLARAGTPPLFCPDALVTSTFPANEEGTRSQRTRWEHGHLGVIVGQVPKLLAEGMVKPGRGLLSLALDLSVPPLALMAMLVAGLSLLSVVAAAAGVALWPLWVAVLATGLFGLAIVLSWHRFGREAISASGLLRAVGYTLGKIPLYFRFLSSRQVEWVRSKRDAAETK
ncbi:glycosyltransferase family 2 protein [Uliginosibacterium sp. H1]|uniref:glycosyltransferase family 2 protein n=1 Tax=Uliginosibacterium sp. H1 TaxID=3114757 RepID=UPI002E19F674|nr:glycosyltransferase family 2 protein [Uliginosibacterium sp. H1]